jgi:hypothetical protein
MGIWESGPKLQVHAAALSVKQPNFKFQLRSGIGGIISWRLCARAYEAEGCDSCEPQWPLRLRALPVHLEQPTSESAAVTSESARDVRVTVMVLRPRRHGRSMAVTAK